MHQKSEMIRGVSFGGGGCITRGGGLLYQQHLIFCFL